MTVSAKIVLRGRKVCGGRAEGEALVTRQTIPGWGGVNTIDVMRETTICKHLGRPVQDVEFARSEPQPT